MAQFLSSWPWQRLGDFKYLLYLPVLTSAALEYHHHIPLLQNFYFHVLAITLLRALVYQLWQTISRFLPWVGRMQIHGHGLSYSQVDREWHCDNHLLFQALLLSAAYNWLPSLRNLPIWNGCAGLLVTFLLHIGPAELLYYCLHRALHANKFLYDSYHKLHHASITPEPSTAGSTSFLEQLLLVFIMCIPVVGGLLTGTSSIGCLYAYLLVFDFLRCYGHSNVELEPLPASMRSRFPLWRTLVYTPLYHALHHETGDCNFCLFVPLYDKLGGTEIGKGREAMLTRQIEEGRRRQEVPDFVFLLHAVDLQSGVHVPFVFRSFAALPYAPKLFLLPLLLLTVPVAVAMWMWGSTFLCWRYRLPHTFHQIWIIPRFGFMYFLPMAHDNINKLIEEAILDADKMGVKVISLAALNKNEALNGGGEYFVKRHPSLKVRVCHGNTLTAAVILRGIPDDVKEVFLTGATSKLGRAIALYLCKRGVRVLMLTASRKRFEAIVEDVASAELQQNLVQVTKYQAGKNCQTWIIGKWLTRAEHMLAPAGTFFHQFMVPPTARLRKDCSYGKLAAIRLPDHTQGLACCEYTLDRNVVHACHAGGVVHALEGWTHHEVGAIDVDRIDIVWEAALKHGLLPAT